MYVTPFVMGVPVVVPSEHIRQRLVDKGVRYTVDPELPRNEVDVLIGAPIIHTIKTGKVERLTDTLVAINTTLGWALSGMEEDASLKAEVA